MAERPETESPDESEEQVTGGPVTHGGEGDPLGGGVAELDDNPRVTEGEPDQSDVGSPRPPA